MDIKLFSVEEANRLIPVLEPLLAALAAKKAELMAKQAELAALLKGATAAPAEARLDSLVRGKEELKFIAEEFNVSLHQVARFGCLVKDVDAGLVDFPSLRGGREVFLCWRRGEPRVGHWHGIDEGFAGRKPLDAPVASAWSEAEGEPADDRDRAASGTVH